MGARRYVVWLATLVAFGGALIAWQPVSLEHADAEPEPEAAVGVVTSRSSHAPAYRHAQQLQDPERLARLLSQLERAREDEKRCKLLDRIAHVDRGGAAIVDVVARYASPPHSRDLRVCAVLALGAIDDPAAVSQLQVLPSTYDEPVLHAVIRALSRHQHPAARAALLALARSGSNVAQVDAAIALAEEADPEALGLLSALLNKATRSAARRLIVAFGDTHDPRVVPLLQNYLSGPNQEAAFDALANLGLPAATRLLLEELSRANSRERALIFRALAKSSDPGARRALFAAAEGGRDASPALSAAQTLEGADASALMLRALQSGDAARQDLAAEYFAKHADPAAIPGLLALLQREDRSLAGSALEALATIGGDHALAAMETQARSRSERQAAALRTLADMPGGEDAAREIALELTRQGGDGSAEAAGMLAMDDSPEAQAALLAAAKRDDLAARQAISALAERDDEASRQALIELSRAEGGSTRAQALARLVDAQAPEALESARLALSARDPGLRESALSMLASIGGDEAERLAIQTSRAADPELARAAIRELGEFDTPETNDSLAQIARGTNHGAAAEALATLTETQPERAVTLFEQLPASSDPAMLSVGLDMIDSLSAPALRGVIERALVGQHSEIESQLRDMLSGSDQRALLRAPLITLADQASLPEPARRRAQELLDALSAELE